jgi:hypothetical protein
MGEVLSLVPRRRRSVAQEGGELPEKLPWETVEYLLRWAMRNGLCFEELEFAIEQVRVWARTHVPEIKKLSWHLTIEGAIRRGWAVEGFQAWNERQSTKYDARSGKKIVKRTQITEECIVAYRKLREERGVR